MAYRLPQVRTGPPGRVRLRRRVLPLPILPLATRREVLPAGISPPTHGNMPARFRVSPVEVHARAVSLPQANRDHKRSHVSA